jgi:hypothetical protein
MRDVLALAITLVGASGLCGQTVATYLATVSQMKTTPSEDNAVPGRKDDMFFVNFKATVRNTTDNAIFVSGDPFIWAKSEILLPSGEWKTMEPSSWHDRRGEKYLPCTKVEPGKTFTFPNLIDMVVIARDRPANRSATVRFHFCNVCMAGSETRTTNFLTERIEINR